LEERTPVVTGSVRKSAFQVAYTILLAGAPIRQPILPDTQWVGQSGDALIRPNNFSEKGSKGIVHTPRLRHLDSWALLACHPPQDRTPRTITAVARALSTPPRFPRVSRRRRRREASGDGSRSAFLARKPQPLSELLFFSSPTTPPPLPPRLGLHSHFGYT
jgi:hypothetical protein